MRLRSLLVTTFAASLLVHAAWAEAPTAKALKQNATQLEQQNATLTTAIQRHQAESKKKTALEAKLASLRKDRAVAKSEKERASLDAQIADGERVSGELAAVLLAHLKAVQKEAREDRRLQGQTKELLVAAQAAKVKLDNVKIDAQMKEASEKADNAMRAAEVQLQTSTVAAALQIAGATAAASASAAPPPAPPSK